MEIKECGVSRLRGMVCAATCLIMAVHAIAKISARDIGNAWDRAITIMPKPALPTAA